MTQLFKVLSFVFFTLVATSQSFAEKAPDFTLFTEAGNQVSLKDFKGQPLVIHFWATWCPYCKKLQPGLDALTVKYKDKGLKMLAISFNEDEGAKPQQVLTKRNIKLTTLIEGDKVAKQYKVKGTPTTVFIDKKGEIIWVTTTSKPDDPKLEQAIKKLTEN